jgi:hypothetical protein
LQVVPCPTGRIQRVVVYGPFQSRRMAASTLKEKNAALELPRRLVSTSTRRSSNGRIEKRENSSALNRLDPSGTTPSADGNRMASVRRLSNSSARMEVSGGPRLGLASRYRRYTHGVVPPVLRDLEHSRAANHRRSHHDERVAHSPAGSHPGGRQGERQGHMRGSHRGRHEG